MKIELTPVFKRDYKKLKKKNYDLSKLDTVINLLINQEKEILINQYKDHQLRGKLKQFRELHIEADWLLVYQIKNDILLILATMGNHDHIFRNAENYT